VTGGDAAMAHRPAASTVGSLRVVRPTTTLRELALETMRDAILGFHFAPGERLVERRLGDLLGVSRTVVREVLRHLEAEGLVETLPHQGPMVAQLDAETIDQIYEMRATIEAMAARACAERIGEEGLAQLRAALTSIEHAFAVSDMRGLLEATTRFYEALFRAGGKNVAWDVVRNLNTRINHLRAMTLSSEGRSQTGPEEMRRIVEAVEARDPDAAERACRHHVECAHDIARKQLQRLHAVRMLTLESEAKRGGGPSIST
jgi:GntR family transcriptional regulator, trigonelline degradation regulator